jgi:hypothetical protein
MLALLLALVAHALSPDLVAARVAETAPLRSSRLDPRAPSVPADAYRRAAAGEVVTGLVDVPGYAARKAWGVAVVDVPVDAYWRAVNDDRLKAEHTAVDYAEVLSGGACAPSRRVFQYLPVSLATDRWWVVDIKSNESLSKATAGRVREYVWSNPSTMTPTTPTSQAWADKGMALAFTNGGWLLVDLDGTHTLIEYWTWTDPGGFVPAGLASSFAAGSIAESIQTFASLARQRKGCG